MRRFSLYRIQVVQVNHTVAWSYRPRFWQQSKIVLGETIVGGWRHFQAVERLYRSILCGRGDILDEGLYSRAFRVAICPFW